MTEEQMKALRAYADDYVRAVANDCGVSAEDQAVLGIPPAPGEPAKAAAPENNLARD